MRCSSTETAGTVAGGPRDGATGCLELLAAGISKAPAVFAAGVAATQGPSAMPCGPGAVAIGGLSASEAAAGRPAGVAQGGRMVCVGGSVCELNAGLSGPGRCSVPQGTSGCRLGTTSAVSMAAVASGTAAATASSTAARPKAAPSSVLPRRPPRSPSSCAVAAFGTPAGPVAGPGRCTVPSGTSGGEMGATGCSAAGGLRVWVGSSAGTAAGEAAGADATAGARRV
mmetsp:Transcript_140823/g.392528  ORF Transcript_140823/g.392528 Transcript_140823/m.392528 type:complete len:227 (-) Transcript_140823:509-1189(-)